MQQPTLPMSLPQKRIREESSEFTMQKKLKYLESSSLDSNISFEGLQNLKAARHNSMSPPYVACNEQKQKEILAEIVKILAEKKQYSSSSAVHIGFSLWFNLDLLSVAEANYALILDFDANMLEIYKKIEYSFRHADSPKQFIEIFLTQLSEKPELMPYPLEYQRKDLQRELEKGYGFLSSLERFLRVKEMIHNGKLFFGSADLTSQEDIQLISNWVDHHKLMIKTLYLSNISEWVLGDNADIEKRENYLNNLKCLFDQNSIIIDAWYPGGKKTLEGPPQRVTVGQLPEFTKPLQTKKIQSKRKVIDENVPQKGREYSVAAFLDSPNQWWNKSPTKQKITHKQDNDMLFLRDNNLNQNSL